MSESAGRSTPQAATCLVQGVGRRYGALTALDAIDLQLFTGVNGLLGPNGAGKTTLLGILATIQRPDAGVIRLLGYDPSDGPSRLLVRRMLGFMPQEPGFHQYFTVFQFVEYVAVLKEWTDRRARRAEVARVLQLVDLENRARDRIRTLSGGMRRRVGLAQALLGDPQLLILDEPTVGLDPEQRLRFRDLLSRLGEDRTVVLSTHQTDDVAALCQHLVVLHQGRLRFDGAPAELARQAEGRVWHASERTPTAAVSWRAGDGRYRQVGNPPAGAELISPNIEDAYLLLLDGAVTPEPLP